MCGLVALVATSPPLSFHADHRSDAAHMEHDHGGHGTVLIDQDEQLLSKTGSFVAPLEATVLPWTDSPLSIERSAQTGAFVHGGRDPPENSRPRAPPISFS